MEDEVNLTVTKNPNPERMWGYQRCHKRLFLENSIQNNKCVVAPQYMRIKKKSSRYINLEILLKSPE